MKKTWNRLLALGLAGLLCGSFAACGSNNNTSSDQGGNQTSSEEPVDATKLQLNISNFDGGYGSEWLTSVKRRYEELHKNDTFADGKVGVQIKINPIKKNIQNIADSVVDGSDHIYFTEYAYYYDLIGKDIFEDITDAVTGDLGAYNQNDASGTTIESKLTDQQKAYYQVDGKYYGIPHYSGYGGLTYNKRLFDTNGYYFAATPKGTSLEGKFISASNPTKSNGPDGIAGTYDDGLPSTYEEFFLLCDNILLDAGIPVMLNGNNYKDYTNYLTKALMTDYEGLEQTMLNYTLNGTATSLATMNSDGTVTIDAEPTVITEENGYQLARQAGKAYAVSFTEQLLTAKDSAYMNDNFDSTSFSHMNAQAKYLGSEADNSNIAMLIEGIWWQSEATQAFKNVAAESGSEFSKEGSDFAWMPLPKATSDKVGEGVTLYDQIYSLCFLKKGVTGETKDVALDFIKFCYTQDSLVEFTEITGTPKAVTYTVSDSEMANMTSFCKSILNIRNQSTTKIVYPYANSTFYQVNQTSLSNLFASIVGGKNFDFEAEVYVTSNYGAKDYFDGLYQYRSTQWSSWKDAADAI